MYVGDDSQNPWDDPNKVIDENPAFTYHPAASGSGGSLKWLAVGALAYWMWNNKNKSKLIPLAGMWYLLTR